MIFELIIKLTKRKLERGVREKDVPDAMQNVCFEMRMENETFKSKKKYGRVMCSAFGRLVVDETRNKKI